MPIMNTDLDHQPMRTFATGATRDTDHGKPQYGGYLSPLVLERYGRYMLKHQTQADGQVRAADNWKKGIPKAAYFESLWRHFVDLCFHMDQRPDLARDPDPEEVLCAILFNTMGLLHEQRQVQLAHDGAMAREAAKLLQSGCSGWSSSSTPPPVS
jgi:hypothetical protein